MTSSPSSFSHSESIAISLHSEPTDGSDGGRNEISALLSEWNAGHWKASLRVPCLILMPERSACACIAFT